MNEQPIVNTDKVQSHAQHASPERNMWMFSRLVRRTDPSQPTGRLDNDIIA